MKKIAIFCAIALGCSFSPSVFAGDATVKWQEPAKFTDIDPGEQEKDKFEANLFRSFDKIFQGLAQKLPENYQWQITITDLDLAGEVRPVPSRSGRPVRDVKTNDRPAISFQYKLLDAQNNVIKEDNVDLKDPMFMSRSPVIVGLTTKPFPYEEYMISQWFDQQQNQKLLPGK
jgi:hypothetical protein